MWKPGIKIGPSEDWNIKLEQSKTEYCEVWYRVDRESSYEKMFAYLTQHNIHTGLHFWGMLDGNILPNLAYPEEQIWKPTLALMKKNIDVANKNKFQYVNIHVGNASLEHSDLDTLTMWSAPNSQVDMDVAEQVFIQNVVELNAYAKDKHVILIVETIPPWDPLNQTDRNSRLTPHNTHGLSNVFVERLGKEFGIALNNDLGHTMAECITDDRDKLWQYLLARTKALAPYVKLIHCNTTIEPFNGTDYHGGITDEDFAQHAFPAKDQLQTLLSLFEHRDDVWVVNEPSDRHVENYNALLQFQTHIGASSIQNT